MMADTLFATPKSRRRALRERCYIALNQLAAGVILVVVSPLMLAIAWIIRRDGSPALFSHYRVGARGKLFKCLKFRSMIADSENVLRRSLDRDRVIREEWERDRKLRDDPRITPIGRFLRRSSLDELPQLINVMRGEMALVGPRPITVDELKRYGQTKRQYLTVLPGMTGLWQVSGRNTTTYQRRVELDEHYVDTRSPWLDVKILARTVVAVMRKDGAL